MDSSDYLEYLINKNIMSRSRSRFPKPKNKVASVAPTKKPAAKAPTLSAQKHSKITEFAQRPGYIIVTLIIALFGAVGGIPGVLQLFTYFNNKPGFEFHFSTISVGLAHPVPNQTVTSIIISGTVENTGSKALHIGDNGFSLQIQRPNGSIIKARKILFPKNITALGVDSLQADYRDTKDLLTVSKVEASETVSGSVYFFSTESFDTIDDSSNVFIFSCTDLNGRIYTSKHRFNPSDDQHYNRVYPNTGLKIYRLEDSNNVKTPY